MDLIYANKVLNSCVKTEKSNAYKFSEINKGEQWYSYLSSGGCYVVDK